MSRKPPIHENAKTNLVLEPKMAPKMAPTTPKITRKSGSQRDRYGETGRGIREECETEQEEE